MLNVPEMQAGVTEDTLQEGGDVQGAWTFIIHLRRTGDYILRKSG